MRMSNTPYDIPKSNKIRIIQHNTARSPNVIQTYLENSIIVVDIVLIQELYISNGHVTILYPIFINIAPNSIARPRVIAFINKNSAEHVTIISRPDIYQDFDIQVLDVFRDDLLNIRLFNVYNERQVDGENNEYTIERILLKIELPTRSIICGDFNAHYS